LDQVHCELRAHDIWQYLQQKHNLRRRQWNKDYHVLSAVEDANNRSLSLLRNGTIADQVIPREEAQAVLQQLTTADSKQGVLLMGEAGVGKTGVMLQVIKKLKAKGTPMLAFRVDHLEPTLLPDHVGQQLGLTASPANVLAAIAQKRDCVLIIDQLDAVSLASGRNTQLFDCIDEIIRQVQAHPRMRLILACRKFDLDNDHRLRQLTGEKGIAEAVTINRFSHEKVKEVVTKLGLDATRLSDKQLDLLSIPLHLTLLAGLADSSTIDAIGFKTAKDLFDQFWEQKRQNVNARLETSDDWPHVIDALCNYMSSQQKQVLSAPETVVDDYAQGAKVMASEHVLSWEGKRISFFHESFFDYAFARRFAARGHELLAFLQSNEQHLFRRAQVRQILLHEREADFDRYLDELRELLNSPSIRFHLKQVVFALLAALDDPKEEEWCIIVPLIGDQDNPHTASLANLA